MLTGAAALHYTTDDEQRRAEAAIGHLPGFVVPLGIDEGVAVADIVPPGRRDRCVLALTRLHPVKNLEALIDAFGTVPAASGWRLIVAGTGDPGYQAVLAERARPIGDRVQFAGWVDGEAKADLIARAAIFALPSHTENFGAGLLEALARGVPAIVSRSINLANEVERAGAGWVVANDAASLADALRRAIEDEGDRAARVLAARAFATRFLWPTVGASLLAEYRRLIAASAAPAAAS
jgi:glycosyltransferase involved in cell wall biosynthesis